MTCAYDKACLERAADTLGRMLDYSAYSLHYDIPSMMDLFIASGDAALFERGDIKIIAGMSGVELAYDVLEKSGLSYERTQSRYAKSRSAEYWCGYTLAQIQWRSCTGFDKIMRSFPVTGFLSEYGKQRLAFLDSLPFNIEETDRIEKIRSFGCRFAEDAASQYMTSSLSGNTAAGKTGARLKQIRLNNGLSQSALAKASGIPLRTIQQYEQGRKDLSKAHAEYLISLARVLNCEPSQLLFNINT